MQQDSFLPNRQSPSDHSALGSARVACKTSRRAQEVIESMGRTEDIRITPDGRWLAVAGFTRNHINLLGFDVSASEGTPVLDIHSALVIRSNSLASPHGIEFIDNRHMVIANREGKLNIFRIPAGVPSGTRIDLQPVATLRSGLKGRVKNPGSIACYALGDGRFRVLACNNYIHTVTSHTGFVPNRASGEGIDPGAVRNDGVLLRRGLSIPDGVCVSTDRRWVAISNHTTGSILLYRMDQNLNRDSLPLCTLEGVVCPHALRFSDSDELLIVADAASPYIHVYRRQGSDWDSMPRPTKTVRVLSEMTFRKGRYNAEEGGPKGLELLHGDRILAITSEHQPLAFFDLDRLMNLPDAEAEDEIRELSRLRDEAMATYGIAVQQEA
jgi:hypothetical protein